MWVLPLEVQQALLTAGSSLQCPPSTFGGSHQAAPILSPPSALTPQAGIARLQAWYQLPGGITLGSS